MRSRPNVAGFPAKETVGSYGAFANGYRSFAR
jgi:hypothetical protein